MEQFEQTTRLSQLNPEQLKSFLDKLGERNPEVRIDLKENQLSIGAHFSVSSGLKEIHFAISKLITGTDFEIERWWDDTQTSSEGFSIVVKKPLEHITMKHAYKLFDIASEAYKRVESL